MPALLRLLPRVSANTVRAAVLGAGDGLLTNTSLILGVAGAQPGAAVVRLAGIASLLAGAFSMAAGELVSVRAAEEMDADRVDQEREQQARDPAGEQAELASMYIARGMSAIDAVAVSGVIHKYPRLALDTHAQLELGLFPEARGTHWQAAAASFGTFAAGAVLPLIPWFILQGTAAVIASVIIAALASTALGAAVGIMAGRNPALTAARQLAVAAVAATVTWWTGHALGVSGV